VLAAIVTAPAIRAGGLAGSPAAEVYGHAWVQWWAAAGWPGWPVGTALADGTASWPAIDPLPTWAVAGLVHLVGTTAAWNTWVFVGIVLAAVGGGAFARALGGSGVVGAAGVATMPILLGSFTSGLTEDYALGLVGLSLAALLADRPLRGGLLLGLTAWCGLYLAWFGAMGALAIGLSRIVRSGRAGWRSALGRQALGGLLAVAIAAPAAAPFRERLAGVGHHSGVFTVGHEPFWKLAPWHGADLAAFGAPGKVDLGDAFVREHPVYLGYTTLALAAAGGFHPAWLGVLACVAVAPGETPTFAGQPLGISNPAIALFDRLPFAGRFNNYARVMLLGQLLLVGLAARGASRVAGWIGSLLGRGAAPQRPARGGPAPPGPRGGSADRATGGLWVWGFAALVVAETAFLSPARLPLPVTPATTPAIYAALSTLPAGLPVGVVGAAGPGIHPQKVFFDQRAHGRRLLHNPNRSMDARPRAGIILVALGAATARVTAERGPPTVSAPDGAAWVVK
jgi:hypothetical protein